MIFLQNLQIGFEAAFTLANLLHAFVGVLLGTLIGVLPGLGPLATISMLLPFSYGLDPLAALIMLAGIYYGAAYGGSTTAILMSLPGETASAVTVVDGYQMALKGRAGVAIATAAIGSFFAGCIGTVLIAVFSVPLTAIAIEFGPQDYFALMTLGLTGAISLASGSLLKSAGMVVLGLIFGIIGTDVNSGVQRLTFGLPQLWDGLDFIVLAVGLFAFGEVASSLREEKGSTGEQRTVTSLFPNRTDYRRMTPSIMRGTALGSLLGLLPGAGMAMASFLSYSLEKRVSKRSSEFGSGAIEGVAGPESANNAAAQTAFIPTLTLGIPGSPTMALLLGALIMHDIQPGPQVITSNPTLFWGLVASMWIGNVMLLILNLPLVGIWVKLLQVPYKFLMPGIIVFSCIGIYSTNYATFDILLTVMIGVFGYGLKALGCEPAPMVLGFVLGPMLEENFQRAMVFSSGEVGILFSTNFAIACFAIALVMICLALAPSLRRQRNELLSEN